jgi:hypothetical protein
MLFKTEDKEITFDPPRICPVCKQNYTKLFHEKICRSLAGYHKHGHDLMVTILCGMIKSKFKSRLCKSERQEFGSESKKCPDFICELDMQSFDLTITEDIIGGYKKKKEKYITTEFGDVIPIVISPNFVIHEESIRSMSKYLNTQAMFT